MTSAEQPDSNPLTRKQMREIRNTAATPIVTPEQLRAADAAPDVVDEAPEEEPETETETEPETVEDSADEEAEAETPAPISLASVPLARAAVPVDVAPAPAPDDSVDLGVSPLTRRQARQQERIRTASVPVITPDIAAGYATPISARPAWAPEPVAVVEAEVEETEAEAVAETEVEAVDTDDEVIALVTEETDQADTDAAEAQDDIEVDQAPVDRPKVNPAFGSELLAGEAAITPVVLPPSFDQLIARETSTEGSSGTPNALILSQTPDGTMMGPVTATGEVLITGTMALPDGLGSQGHAHGAADGHEADAVLVDGELPAHSSPTPIAASAAISTVKSTGEIIRPPAPEKGGKLMLSLAITAGVLALALVGVLILAFVTGVF